MAGQARPLPERFWEKVDKTDGCWLWTGYTNARGYGQFYTGAGKKLSAHIVAYLITGGIVPPGLELDHLCRNPSCVNPAHLEPVTHRENMLRGHNVASRAASATHCPRGHAYNAENTVYTKRGHRRCRTCARARQGYTGVGSRAPKTHCKYGHPFDEANTRITPRGHQVCRACHRASVKADKQKKRADVIAERVKRQEVA